MRTLSIRLNRAAAGRRFVLAALAAMNSVAHATDYSASASLNTHISHNDNLRLTEQNEISVQKYMLSPTFGLDAKTETSNLALTSVFYFNRYSKRDFDSDDQNIGLAYSHEFERNHLGLNLNFVRESTITSETLTSGIIGNTAERTERYVASPSWTYTLNESNLLQLTGSFSKQDYNADNYVNYRNYGGWIDWIHILDERIKLVVDANFSDYRSDDRAFQVPLFGQQFYSTRSKNKGAMLGADYQWSEQTKLSARVGRSKNEQETPIGDPTNICGDALYQQLVEIGFKVGGVCSPLPTEKSTLSTVDLDWTWKNERHEASFHTTKSTQPSNGSVVDALRLDSRWSYRLTELDQLTADIAVVRNREIGDRTVQVNPLSDRDYYSASLNYRRRINAEWSVSGGYRYNRQRYKEQDIDANSNTVLLNVLYQPQVWHWSR